VNSTSQLQIDAIRSAADDLEKVEGIIMQKKELLKNSKEVRETDTLLAELEALDWLQGQIAGSRLLWRTKKQLCGKSLVS
jgi:hypothetical protein